MPFDGTNFEQRDEVLELLRRARERIALPGGWVQHFGYFEGGYCAVGAINSLGVHPPLYLTLVSLVALEIHSDLGKISCWREGLLITTTRPAAPRPRSSRCTIARLRCGRKSAHERRGGNMTRRVMVYPMSIPFWLDWRLFGNGKGMASPYLDDAFFWLNGHMYQWIGGFGAQLSSIEWRAPKAGTRREILGRNFVVFSVQRRLLRVRVSWALPTQPNDYGEVAQLKKELFNWGHGT